MIRFALACALLVGCAHTPVETMVRRCDSLGDLASTSRELGRDGWHVASVAALQGGWSYVVVFERNALAVHP